MYICEYFGMFFDYIWKKNFNDFDEYICMIILLIKEVFFLFRICEFIIYNC